MIGLSVSTPQSVPKFWFENRNNVYQGTVDEFLAIKTTTERVIGPHHSQIPCIPHQFHPSRSKRSPHYKKKKVVPVYPINIYEQHINQFVQSENVAKPEYNHYGGYYCGNEKPVHQTQQPVHNNNFFPFLNIFNGILGVKRAAVDASPADYHNIGTRPVYDLNYRDNNNPNKV